MEDYFNQLLDNTLPENGEELVTEAVYAGSLPYLKTLNRQVVLPKGTPVGKGILCFLYSKSIDDSISLINEPANFKAVPKYKNYYYSRIYRGKIYNKRYRYNEFENRKEIYSKVTDATGVRCLKEFTPTLSAGRNTYYDLSKYLEIFDSIAGNLQPLKYIQYYWAYLAASTSVADEGINEKFILCDISKFPIGKDINASLKNPLYAMYYTLFRAASVKNSDLFFGVNIDFYFFNKKLILKVNPSKLSRGSDLTKLRAEMKKIMRSVSSVTDIENSTDEDNILKEEIKGKETEAITSVIEPKEAIIINGKSEALNATAAVTKQAKDAIKKASDKVPTPDLDKFRDANTTEPEVVKEPDETDTELPVDKDKVSDEMHAQIRDELEQDKEILQQIYRQTMRQAAEKSQASSARDKKLQEEQMDIKVGDVTIKDLEQIKPIDIPVPSQDISRTLTTTNENMKLVKFNNFEKEYNKKLMKKDIMDAIISLNDKSIPAYILQVDIEDTSDELNYKDTYTIKLEDVNRKRHTIKVDIPKFLDDKFLYIGGNKKIIKYQNFFYPIVKISEDTVLVVSNYNKLTLTRKDTKSVSYIERLSKLISAHEELQNNFTLRNVSNNNKNYITTLEYDEISKIISKYSKGKTTFFFDQGEAVSYVEKNDIKVPKNNIFIGIINNNPIFVDIDTQRTKDGKNIIEMLVDALGPDLKEQYGRIRLPKRLIYTQITIMSKDIPLALLLGIWEGISSVMQKLNLKYRLEDKIPSDLKANEAYIKFSDCVLVYEDSIPAGLIMNGFRTLDTSTYSLLDFDKRETYIPYMIKRYGQAQIENALINFYEFMLDPITVEILAARNQPTQIVNALIYGSNLLADSQYTQEINQNMNRIRSNEIISGILYANLANAYIKYRASNGRQGLSVKRDCVITDLMALKTVEDYSTLNPIVELQQSSAISAKGFKGVNLDESYTVPKRSYDPSMVGTIAAGTSPDGSCGVSRTLTMEPAITNLRGFVDATASEHKDKLKDVNVFSASELTLPLATTLDDPNRLGHSIKQNSHVVPVKDAAPVLISNGLEERARFTLTSDFVINAEESGEIVDYDESSNIMIAKYKSGKCRAINLNPNMVKNGGGGFWLSNKLITPYKVGDKFKKDDVLAYHKDFFSNSKYNNARMNLGCITKIAIMSTYGSYEDAAVITKSLSERAGTEMCFLKSAVIGKNSNVTYLAKKGDTVEVGDVLVQFDTSYEDESVNTLLAALGDEDRQQILAMSRNEIRSKYSGVIEEVKIYSTVDMDELSPSLQKIVGDYYKTIRHKKAFLDKYDPENKNSIIKCGMLVSDTTNKIQPNKYGVVKGEHAEDSVLIEFYIKHLEPLEIGSKIANYTALKNTICEIIPPSYEPYSEFHKDEEVSGFVASNSILGRMTPSIILSALGNKCIIELKRTLQKIYEE